MTEPTGVLAGYRVIDCSIAMAGPFAPSGSATSAPT